MRESRRSADGVGGEDDPVDEIGPLVNWRLTGTKGYSAFPRGDPTDNKGKIACRAAVNAAKANEASLEGGEFHFAAANVTQVLGGVWISPTAITATVISPESAWGSLACHSSRTSRAVLLPLIRRLLRKQFSADFRARSMIGGLDNHSRPN
ncbi:hypothetical protein C8J57DRAFT_1246135 [Mycena rebaudengoi]|nr:hypothetical protein C8J57DRAFT_1246135 [Mycena rebaudengoi]